MRARKIRQLHRLSDRLDHWITDAEPVTHTTAHISEVNSLLIDAQHLIREAELIAVRHQTRKQATFGKE
jgi:hypothetical protein